jgi:hypothetical protein
MRGRVSTRKRAWLGGIACAGVAAAHWIAYAIAPPSGHSHAEGLAATGHRLWPYFMAVFAGAFVAGLGGFVADRLGAGGDSGAVLWRHAAARLAPVQVVAFVVLELVERALFADPTHSTGLLAEPVLWTGIVLQVLCALAGAGLLVVFARTIELIQELVARRSLPAAGKAAPLHRLATQLHARPLVMAAGGPTFRGPPALS